MTKTGVELLKRLKSLNGSRLKHVRVAGNSLILYFRNYPGERDTLSIWLDPPWAVRHHGLTVMLSAELTSKLSKREHSKICKKGPFNISKQVLRGSSLIDEDIDLSFMNGYSITKYCAEDDPTWFEWKLIDGKEHDWFELRLGKVRKYRDRKVNAPLLPKRK